MEKHNSAPWKARGALGKIYAFIMFYYAGAQSLLIITADINLPAGQTLFCETYRSKIKRKHKLIKIQAQID
jgi:hypothetical protein